MGQKSSSYDKLFQEYLNVCNQAIEKNKNKFPYKQILGATENLLDDRSITMAIYDDQPKATFDIKLKDNNFSMDKPEEQHNKHAWHVNKSYLEEVVNNPEVYINNPAKIDWDWLKSRVRP